MSVEHPFTPPRRAALQQESLGFGWLALTSLLADEARANAQKPHFKPRAKNVIFLFMDGGVSHVDSFDPKPELDRRHGQKVGNVLQFESGFVAGHKFYPNGRDKAEPLPEVDVELNGPGNNFANFIHAVRTRKREEQHADILEGHYSSALCHLPNISYRLGEDEPYDPSRSTDLAAWADAMARMASHLKDNGLKFDQASIRRGRVVHVDPKTEQPTDGPEVAKLFTREYRKPYVYDESA